MSHRLFAVAILAFASVMLPGSGDDAVASPRADRPATPAGEVGAALRSGDLDAAREALGRWIAIAPDNPRLRYNMACLDARLDAPDDAVAALAQAFRLGFDDLRRAQDDPDLASLRKHEGFLALIGETSAALAAVATERTLRLPWADARHLTMLDAQGRPSPARSASASVDEQGLAVVVTVPTGDIEPGPAPWYEGGGVVVTVAAPGPDDRFDSERAWRFGFGMKDGLATGMVLNHPGRVLDQNVLDLAPRIDRDAAAGSATVAIRIPWAHTAPYAPPADTMFGLNVEVVGPGGEPAAALVRDPASGFTSAPRRRYTPVIVEPGAATPPSLQGRVANTVVGNRPLAIDLTAWFPTDGHSELFTEIQDMDGNSLVTAGETAGDVEIVAGRNDWRRWADLSRLPDGPYRLLATLALDDGEVLTWGAGLFRFGGEWMPRTRDRIKPLPEAEKPSIFWRLELVSDALIGRDPRRSPATLITTVAETDRLLERFRNTGTILPSGGSLDAFVPSADGVGHAVLVITPEGWSRETKAPVVILDGPDGMDADLRERDAFADGPVVVRLPAETAGDPLVIESVVMWLHGLLPGGRTVLVTDRPGFTAGEHAADEQVVWRDGIDDVAAEIRAAVAGNGR